ncbi:MAG: nonstructural protein [Microvirus sp.]|nr:MAG: nonstructural protein [Microvirus sp.]
MESYLPPFYVVAPGQAIRLFEDGCGDKESPFGKHPGDYKLYQIGTFDDQDAVWEQLSPVQLVCSGSDWLASQELRVSRG